MEIRKLFPVPFWQTKLTVDPTEAAAKCISMRDSNHPSRIVSNRGGWQSKPIKLESIPEFKPLADDLKSILKLIASSINPEVKFMFANAWVNVNEQGDSNSRHNHVGAALSAVIYLQVDEKSGRIKFYDDNSPIKHYPFRMPPNRNHFRLEESFTPYSGMVLVFPAWMPHDVEPSRSDKARISIAVNIHVADVYD